MTDYCPQVRLRATLAKYSFVCIGGVFLQAVLYGNLGWFQPLWWPLFCFALVLAKKSRIIRVILFVILVNYYFPLNQQAGTNQYQIYKLDNGLVVVQRDFSYQNDPDYYYLTQCGYVDRQGKVASFIELRGWLAARPTWISQGNGEYRLFFNAYYDATVSNKKLRISGYRFSRVVDLESLPESGKTPEFQFPPRELPRILFQE